MTFEIADLTKGGERRTAETLDALGPARLALLDGPVVVTLATLRKSGSPLLSVIWCSRDDGHVYINSAKGRAKDRNLQARPDVSLMLMDPQDPFHWLAIEGRIVESVFEDDPKRGAEATHHIDDMTEVYLNTRPYPNRSPGEVRVKYKIEPARILTFGPLSAG